MSNKRVQGFSSTSGIGLAPKKAPSYTSQELQAMSKLQSNAAYSGSVCMCDVCGRPISSSSPFDKEDDKFSYSEQASFKHESGTGTGRHFNCNSMKIQREQARSKEQYENLPQSEKDKLEEIAAKKFNEGDGVDKRIDHVLTTPVNTKPAAFIPKAGELSLDKIKEAGGLSKLPPHLPVPDLTSNAKEQERLDLQEKQREEQLKADFIAQQASMESQSIPPEIRKERILAHEKFEEENPDHAKDLEAVKKPKNKRGKHNPDIPTKDSLPKDDNDEAKAVVHPKNL